MSPAEAGPGGADDFVARVAAATLDDVPVEALRAGLRLPLHDFVGLELVGLRPVVVQCALTEQVRSVGLPLHGGIAATLVDVAANLAAATGGSVDVRRSGLVTGRMELDYRAQPAGSWVRAEGQVLEQEARTVRTGVTVTDERGRTVASALVWSRVVPRRAGGAAPDGPATAW